MPISQNAILKINENREISQVARLEAEMTFMKLSLPDKKGADSVYLYPELVETKEDLFLFAMSYGKALAQLQHGLSKVSKQVKEMFPNSIVQ